MTPSIFGNSEKTELAQKKTKTKKTAAYKGKKNQTASEKGAVFQKTVTTGNRQKR